ncbi:MAG: peptidylprolyl isomerase [Pirellulales bacterium]
MATVGHAAAFPAEGVQTEGQRAKAAASVAATVNGEPIDEDRVVAEAEKALATFRRFGMRKESPDLLRTLRQKALDKFIDDELLLQASRKLKIDDIDGKVEQVVKGLEAKYGAGKGIEGYLKRRSLTLDEFKKSARAKVSVDEYLKSQGILEPEIPEDRIRRTYQEDPQSYSREESVNVSHILIAADAHAGADAKKKARQKAEEIRAEILKGGDFAEMAKKHSNCNSAAGGGELGFVKKGFMPKEFDKVAFSLEKGVVSEVVETKFGYHVIKVLDKKPAGVIPYEEVRDFIRKYLQEEESKKRLASHIVELRKKAKIEILLK